jgi:hypothetical protein
MTAFPDSVYSPRSRENRPGIVFDAAKKQIVYAEDLQAIENEIVAIETELIANPGGGGGAFYRATGDAITENVVLFADPTMKATLEAGHLYNAKFFIVFQSHSTPDFKYKVVGNGDWQGLGTFTYANVTAAIKLINTEYYIALSDANFHIIELNFTIDTSEGADDLEFHWSQNTSSTYETLLSPLSFLEVKKIS